MIGDYLVMYYCEDCSEEFYFSPDSLPGGKEHCEYCEDCGGKLIIAAEMERRMNYAELTDDELRLEVAKRCGKRLELDRSGRFWLECLPDGTRRVLPYYCTDLTAAIALLESTGYEWAVSVELYDHAGDGEKYSKPLYHVAIFGEYCDIEWDADTLANAACRAWLYWKDAQHDNE